MKKQISPSSVTRRKAFKSFAGFGAALAWPGSKVIGANDDIRCAVVGVNSRGKAHIGGLSAIKGVRVTAICDVDPAVLDARVTGLTKQVGHKVEGHADVRKLIESKEYDVITTATPNHWHSLIAVWASQAGKDSYIEKPISHTVWEGRQVVNASRQNKTICAGGTQSRSMETIQQAVEYVHSGKLGKIEFAKGLCYKPRQSIGEGAGGEIPAGLDYDLWCGPAQIEDPLRRKRFHYDWHWFYEYGNGDMGNQGIHQMDLARWFLGEKKLAPMVMSIGDRLGYVDNGTTPNTQLVYHAYEAAPLIFETRGLPSNRAAQKDGWGKKMDKPEEFPGDGGIAVIVQCENGRVYCSSGGKVKITDNDGEQVHEIKGATGTNLHFENFIKAVRSRKHTDLNADCEETHYSSALCHTGLISHQLGVPMHGNEVREQIAGDKFLTGRYAAMEEHLERNEVPLGEQTITLGAALKFDPDTEKFTGNAGDLDAKANALAKRAYRTPYEVPDLG
jgi:predicted dehydrogenase